MIYSNTQQVMPKLLGITLAATFAVTALCQTADAQTLNNQQLNQVRTQPGQIQQYFQKNPDALKNENLSPDAPPEPEVIKEDAPQPIDPSLTRAFPVSDIQVDDLTLLDDSDVDELVEPYLAKGELSFMDLQDLADELTQVMRDEGYVTSRVYIPPQKIDNGVVHLTAAEGVVGSVEYMEKRHFGDRAVEPRFSLDEDDLLHEDAIARSLRRINRNPDLQVAAVLKAGQNLDETDIELRPTYENHPYHIKLNWDNLGRYQIGKKRLGITTTHNNLLGFGDQISNTLAWTRRSFSTVTGYKVPVGAHGTTLNFDHAHSRLDLGEDAIAQLNVQADVNIYSPYVSQELINTQNHLLSADLGLDFKNVNTKGNGLKFLDRVRNLRAALNYEGNDSTGRTFLNNEVAIGIDWLGGRNSLLRQNSTPLSRNNAGSQFVRVTSALTRVQRMPFGTFGVFRALGQYTPDRLPPIEQFQVGGAYTVRGYTEGELIGDQGFVLSGEWHIPFFIVPSSWTIPGTQYGLRDNIQFVTFTDFGATYTHNALPGERTNEYAWGVGVGLRAKLTELLTARVDLGVPLLRQPSEFGLTDPSKNRQANPRLHFGLETQLF